MDLFPNKPTAFFDYEKHFCFEEVPLKKTEI